MSNSPKMQNDVQVERVETGKLVPYARNARTHSEAQVQQIAGSIREFGFTNPVLIDDENGIIAGHGRVLAAQLLGLADVPCIRLSHLNETQRRAYVLADNRIALNSGWDDAMLAIELAELQIDGVDLGALGFDDGELDKLLSGPEFQPSNIDDQPSLDRLVPKMVTCPNCGTDFDINGCEDVQE